MSTEGGLGGLLGSLLGSKRRRHRQDASGSPRREAWLRSRGDRVQVAGARQPGWTDAVPPGRRPVVGRRAGCVSGTAPATAPPNMPQPGRMPHRWGCRNPARCHSRECRRRAASPARSAPDQMPQPGKAQGQMPQGGRMPQPGQMPSPAPRPNLQPPTGGGQGPAGRCPRSGEASTRPLPQTGPVAGGFTDLLDRLRKAGLQRPGCLLGGRWLETSRSTPGRSPRAIGQQQLTDNGLPGGDSPSEAADGLAKALPRGRQPVTPDGQLPSQDAVQSRPRRLMGQLTPSADRRKRVARVTTGGPGRRAAAATRAEDQDRDLGGCRGVRRGATVAPAALPSAFPSPLGLSLPHHWPDRSVNLASDLSARSGGRSAAAAGGPAAGRGAGRD